MSHENMKVGGFCWNELMTPDTKKAKEFYSKMFGWEYEDQQVGDHTYSMLKKDGEHIGGGMMQIPAEHKNEIPPHWMSYILVEDLDKAIEKAKSLGATVKVPATPVSDYGRFSVLIDPTGAYISIWQSLKSC